MLRRIHDSERGASLIEYGAVVLLVAAILSGLLSSGLVDAISTGVTGAIDKLTLADEEIDPAAEDPADPFSSQEPDTSPAPVTRQDDERGEPGGGDGQATPADNDGGGTPDVAPAINTPKSGPSGNDPEQLTNAGRNAQPIGWWDQVKGFGQTIGEQAEKSTKETFNDTKKGWNDFWSGPTDYVTDKAGDTWSSMEQMSADLDKKLEPYVKVRDERYARGEYVKGTAGVIYDYWRVVGTGAAKAEAEAIFDENYWKADREGRQGDALAYAFWNGVAGHFSPGRYTKILDGAVKGPKPSVLADRGKEPKGTGKEPDKDKEEKEDEPTGASCPRTKNSFLPGTPVLMADGSTSPIEDVDIGDEVHAFDPHTGEEGPRPVTDLIEDKGKKTLVKITVTDQDGDTGTVTATDEHPFWAPELSQWVDAIDLTPDTWLRTSAGTWAQVAAVEQRVANDQQVHNLSVGDLNTYYTVVNEAAVLTHNEDDEEDCEDGNASNPAQHERYKNQLKSEQISTGHAYKKHVVGEGQFPGVRTKKEFQEVIFNVMQEGEVRHLGGGRTAYWKGTVVVIHNPKAKDGGTAFVPEKGRVYFERLK